MGSRSDHLNVERRSPIDRIRGRTLLPDIPGTRYYFLSAFTLSLVNSTPIPLLTDLRDSFDLSNQQIAFLGSFGGLGMVITNWPVGYLIHRFGSRRMLALGLLPLAAGPILSAMALSYWLLLLGSLLTGIGFATLLTTNIGGLGELAESRSIGATMGHLNRTMMIGTLTGPILSGMIAGAVDWRLSYGVVGAIACGLLVHLMMAYDTIAGTGGEGILESEPRTPSGSFAKVGRLLSDGIQRPLFLVFFLYFFVIFSRGAIVQYLVPLMGKDLIGLSVQSVGGLLSLGTLITMVAVVPTGILADRLGSKPTLLLVTTSLLLAEILLLVDPSLVIYTVAILFVGLAGTGTSVVYTLYSVLSRQHTSRRSLGPFRFAGDMGVVLGPLSMGFLVERLGFRAGLLGTIGLAFCALICLVVSMRRDTGRANCNSQSH